MYTSTKTSISPPPTIYDPPHANSSVIRTYRVQHAPRPLLPTCETYNKLRRYGRFNQHRLFREWGLSMKQLSPAGLTVVAIGALVAIAFWVVGFFGLPNDVTHRNLAQNPKLAVSVATTNANKGGGTSPSSPSSQSGAGQTAPIAKLDKAAKTIDLNITTDQDMAFNGYSKGALKIAVPTGWTVKVKFSDTSNIQHSVGFTDWSHRQGTTFPAAFSHSLMPGFQTGITSSHPPVAFQFKADKAGKYAMVCGIPGHASMGMWDEFDVSNNLSSPTITTDKGTQKAS